MDAPDYDADEPENSDSESLNTQIAERANELVKSRFLMILLLMKKIFQVNLAILNQNLEEQPHKWPGSYRNL